MSDDRLNKFREYDTEHKNWDERTAKLMKKSAIVKSKFKAMVREYMKPECTRLNNEAVLLIQSALEHQLERVYEKAVFNAWHAGRHTVHLDDVALARLELCP